ncbi:DegV family protein with EDD domain [Alkalibacillus filiformis]|uniref:DegV family protein with EDD domain n=1 Tax=Alkalibacillus filiformis TaxID=200990 RepID=A0ABU0DWQ9_9BACI|nr:DegV family protein [Alkalibacillus filiformis]MDQ0352909.1 DegV family protein with EDD domain [Alkalibacillus filiformis]
MKTAVLTDSTAYIPQEQLDHWNIYMVPLSVTFGDESYRELVDITTREFYEKVRTEKDLPKTSQPSVGDFTTKFEEIANDYDAVVSIHLSSGISGTYQAAVSAGDMVEGLEVHPFDSEISCMAQGFYVLEAAQMAQDGATPEEILNRLKEMKQDMSAYFMVDDLSHLARGGRLTGAQAMVGSLLQVKPLLHFEDTKIVPFEKIRTSKKAYKRMENLLKEAADEADEMKAVIIHAEREEIAKKWKDELSEKYPNVEFTISYFGPVIGTHLGEGGIGLGWYKVK